MKRKLFAGAVVLMCLSLLAYGTLAYFTAENTAHNVITSGSVGIALREWADEQKTEPFPEDGVSGVMPGTQVTKIVEVENTGASAAYIRVRVETEIALAQGELDQLETGLITLDIDESRWALGSDGFYYYRQALQPGEVTAPLFTAVRFDPGMDDRYQGSSASVTIKAYAVQAANNGESALTAQGWPEA